MTTKKTKKVVSNSPSETSHIGQSTKINGNIITEGNMRFDGELVGDIFCESKVVLGPKSKLKGNLKAFSADIAGLVEGLVETSEELILRKTAVLHADIVAGSMVIESGALFNGSTKMNKNGREK
jgi:cytoskeletal protein CcmA (bactofilin family)